MRINKAFLIGAMAASLLPHTVSAQENAGDSVMQHITGNRLSVGGYGEVAFTRNFFSDNVYRYARPENYKNDPSHGRFDLPHAVVYLSYDFGHGWTFGTEIEFEHTGTGSAVEKEFEEAGEWEQEVEKGGEVELEQFWIQKSFGRALNLRIGHIIVPVGLNNAHHEPLNFFTVYRPEGENTILPSTWHETGFSLWGHHGDFRYELQMVAGLDAFMFNTDRWVHYGTSSPYEFKVANKYGFAARIDNYTVPGLRLGLSGYYGQTMHNTYPHDLEGKNANGTTKRHNDIKGTLWIGSFDFTYKGHNWIARGNADWGYLANAKEISDVKRNLTSGNSPYKKANVSKNAMAVGVEAGYDVFSQIRPLRAANKKLYVFGRYEYYDSYIPAGNKDVNDYTNIHRMAVGLNYYPLPQIVIKGEYSKRFLKSAYNNEPSVSIGVAYEGFFL